MKFLGKYLIIENVYICITWDLRRKSVPSQDQKVQRYLNQLRSRLINFLLIVLKSAGDLYSDTDVPLKKKPRVIKSILATDGAYEHKMHVSHPGHGTATASISK